MEDSVSDMQRCLNREGCVIRFAVIVCLLGSLLQGCATWNISVGRDGNRVNTVQEVAGTTLSCAAQAQRSAIIEMALSALAGTTSGLLASAASSAALSGDFTGASTLSLFSGIASGVAVGLNISSWFSLGTSVAYTDRAGLVLAGLQSTGCNAGPPLPSTGTPDFGLGSPVSPRQKIQRGGGTVAPAASPAVGRCSTAEVEEMRASGVSESAIERACTP